MTSRSPSGWPKSLALPLTTLLTRARRYGLGAGQLTRRALSGRRTKLDEEVLLDEVFLRRLERLNLLARQATRTGGVGEHRSRRRAASLEFADYRRYVAGDDLRRIDWNVYGRTGNLFLKLTEAKEDVILHLLVDSSQSMNWGKPNKLLYARQIVAALGYLALARFDAVTVATFGDRLRERLPLTRGKGQALALLGFLNNITVGGTTDLDSSLGSYAAGRSRGGVAVVVSDLLCEEGRDDRPNSQRLLGIQRLLQTGLEVTVVHVLDPHELRPDLSGELELVDAETGDLVEITVGEEALRAYEERVVAWCQSIKDALASFGVTYILADSSVPLESLMLSELRQRRLVR